MAEAPIMPLATDAYLADTVHLSTIEHGAYLLLLMCMWRSGGSLPNDAKQLAKFTRLSPKQFARIWPSLEPFFHVEEDRIWHGKLQDFLVAVRQKSAKASDSARAKWRKTKETQHADASPEQCERNAIHKPRSKKETTSVVSKKTGSRLPEDWVLTKGLGEWAIAQGMDPPQVRVEADKFRDHWHSVPGAKGRKLDWPATWRNWIRKALESAPRTPSPANGGPNGRFANVMEDARRADGRTEADSGMADGAGGDVPGPLFPAGRRRNGVPDANCRLAGRSHGSSTGSDRTGHAGTQAQSGQNAADDWRDQGGGEIIDLPIATYATR